jgi:hypothetical protein
MVLERIRQITIDSQLDVLRKQSVYFQLRSGARLNEPIAQGKGSLKERKQKIELVVLISSRRRPFIPALYALQLALPAS